MRITVVAALALVAGPAFAQITDPPSTSRSRDAAGSTRTATYVGGSDCMGLWEPATHMTKQEWQRTCQRVQGRLQEIRQIETETKAPPASKK